MKKTLNRKAVLWKTGLVFLVMTITLICSALLVSAADYTGTESTDSTGEKKIIWKGTEGTTEKIYIETINKDEKSGTLEQGEIKNDENSIYYKASWTYESETKTFTLTLTQGNRIPQIRNVIKKDSANATVEALWYQKYGEEVEKVVIANNTTLTTGYGLIGGDFKDCSNLKKVIYPDGITNLGYESFANCTQLVPEIPGTAAYIGGRCFAGCNASEIIKIPNTVTYFDNNVFTGCQNIKQIVFEPSDTRSELKVCYQSFDGMNNLKIVVLPNETIVQTYKADYNKGFKVTTNTSFNVLYEAASKTDNDASFLYTVKTAVGNSWKYKDQDGKFVSANLNSWEIPSGGSYADAGMMNALSGNNSIWYLLNTGELVLTGTGKTYGGDVNTQPYAAYKDKITKVTVKDGITDIQYNSFNGYDEIKSVEFPENKEGGKELILGWQAFKGCTKLESIKIPSYITFSGGNVFEGCTNLKTIDLENGLASIGTYIFASCGVESITIPVSVTEIGPYAFMNCKSLTSVKFENPETSKCTIIGVSAFHGAENIEGDVTFPKALKQMGNYAMLASSGKLKSVHFLGGYPNVLVRNESTKSYEVDSNKSLTDVFYNQRQLGIWYPENDSTWTKEKIAALDAEKYSDGTEQFITSPNGLFVTAKLESNGTSKVYYYNGSGEEKSLLILVAGYKDDLFGGAKIICNKKLESGTGSNGYITNNTTGIDVQNNDYRLYTWTDALVPLLNVVKPTTNN